MLSIISVFRMQPKIYDEAFFLKLVKGLMLLTNFQIGSKYVSQHVFRRWQELEMPKTYRSTYQIDFTGFLGRRCSDSFIQTNHYLILGFLISRLNLQMPLIWSNKMFN